MFALRPGDQLNFSIFIKRTFGFAGRPAVSEAGHIANTNVCGHYNAKLQSAYKILEQYEKIDLYRRIVRAKLYIDKHFAENLDLDNISGQAYFSKFHFIRIFNSIYGLTPKNYLIRQRIDNAKKYLANGHSVVETGFMVGLESPTSFAGMFKKITGLTPSNYKKLENIKRMRIIQNPLQFVPNCFAETHGWKE